MNRNDQLQFEEAQTFPVDLDFGEAGLPQKTAPEASVRNRASMLTLLSAQPDQIIEQYKSFITESQAGRSDLIDSVEKNVLDNLKMKNFDMGLMAVLSDPEVSIEQKEQAVQNFNNTPENQDLTSAFATESLIAPSEGESVEAEEARTNTGIAFFKNLQDSISEEQALVNLAIADFAGQATALGEASGVAEMVLIPAEEGFKTASLLRNLAEKEGKDSPFSKVVKAFLRPGATIEDIREEYSVLSPEARLDFLRSTISAVKDSSSVVIPRGSQLQAIMMLEKIVGDYDATDAAIDTAINALDIIFPVSGLLVANRAAKMAGAVGGKAGAQTIDSVVEGAKLTEKEAADLSLASKPSDPTGSANYARIQELEKEHTELLQASQQLQEPGAISSIQLEIKLLDDRSKALTEGMRAQVKELQASHGMSFKEAKKRVDAQINEQMTDITATKQRLQNMLDANADSAKSANRLKQIEEEIVKLKKTDRQVPLKKNAIIDSIERNNLNSVTHTRMPASPGNILMVTNPQKARNAVSAAINAQGDDVALALFGVPKADVLADVALPKLTTDSGIVAAKPVDVLRDSDVSVPADVMQHARAAAGDELTDVEIEQGYAIIKNDFLNATGVKVVGGMDGFRMDTNGAHVKISSVYGGSEGSFLYPEDAVEQVKRALRSYGVETDNVTVMRKDGVNFVPVDLERVRGDKGEYYARVEIGHRIEASDLGEGLEGFTLKRNWLDSIGVTVSDTAGSLTRMLVDAASIFDPKVMKGASRAADKAASLGKAMARMANDFAQIYNKLPKARKQALDDYIFKANRDGIAFNPAALKSQFNEKELEALWHFRRFWDSHFFLENLDVVRSLRAGKFGLLDNGKDRFFAKPVPKQYSLNRVYDPDSGTVRNLSPEEMTELYDKGGSVAELKAAETINGEEITHILSDPTKGSYLRRVKDDDVALNYRDGYYQVTYNSNHFIYELKADGTPGAVKAVAGSRKDAEFTMKRMEQTTGVKYGVRGDERIIPRDSKEYWELNSASGRISQRYRGKPLVEANASNIVGTQQYIDGPVDAAVRAANSIANRTSYRLVIDTIKKRAVQQYADVFPKDDFQRTRWPSSVSEITAKGKATSKQIRDARTTFEYVNYLEKGYINHLDEGFKYAFLWVGEAAADASIKGGAISGKVLEGIEKGAFGTVRSGVTPTNLGKGFVFFNYIVANMFRQWIVQPAQSLRLVSYNPAGLASGSAVRNAFGYFNDKYLFKKENASDFTKFVDESGMIDAIDKSSLVRGTLMAASERSNWYNKTVGKGVDVMRKAGYDFGEMMNLVNHLAFVYDKFKRDGKNLKDIRVRSEAAHLARQLSYGFNMAGDFAYTHNAAAIVTQFLQVPHKAVLQYTNRSISPEIRKRMFVGDLMLYGAPTALLAGMLGPDFLKDNPELRETVSTGLMHRILNFTATQVFGEEVDIAWEDSLSPYDFGGFSKIVEAALQDGGVLEALSNTPAGSLITKDGSRVQKAMLSTMRYLGLAEDSEEFPESFKDVVSNIAGITSMWSNYQKGKLVLATQKLMNKHGQVIAENVNSFEAVAIILGFQPSEVGALYEASTKIRDQNNAYKDEIYQSVGTIVEVAVGKTKLPITDPTTISVVNSLIMSTFKEDPWAYKLARQRMSMYYKDPKTGLKNAIAEQIFNPQLGTDVWEHIDSLPNPKDREDIVKLQSDFQNSMKAYMQNEKGNE